MILLSLQLQLQGGKPEPALNDSPFLGGVLHGSFEHLIRLYTPEIADKLQMTQHTRPKCYAVLPPPYGWHTAANAGAPPDNRLLGCGIVLFGTARQYLTSIPPVLQRWREIRIDGRVDTIKQIDIHICAPGNKPCLWSDSNNTLLENIAPDFSYSFMESRRVNIQFITPLILESTAQKAAGAKNTPPGLLRLVRSLTKRIQALEPELAIKLGMQSPAWVDAEEQIRHIPIVHHDLKRVQWKYGSRTKKHPVIRSGLIGQIHYNGPIPAPIIALLNWGCWFGIGQGASLGQGMYVIKNS